MLLLQPAPSIWLPPLPPPPNLTGNGVWLWTQLYFYCIVKFCEIKVLYGIKFCSIGDSCHVMLIYNLYRNVAAVVGVLWLAWLSIQAIKALLGDFHAFVLAPLGILRPNLKKYGSWAGKSCNIYASKLL